MERAVTVSNVPAFLGQPLRPPIDAVLPRPLPHRERGPDGAVQCPPDGANAEPVRTGGEGGDIGKVPFGQPARKQAVVECVEPDHQDAPAFSHAIPREEVPPSRAAPQA